MALSFALNCLLADFFPFGIHPAVPLQDEQHKFIIVGTGQGGKRMTLKTAGLILLSFMREDFLFQLTYFS